MFTALAIKNFASNVLSFLWKYKWGILVGALLTFLWIRGNHYQEKYEQETIAHKQERAEHLVTRIENELTLRQLQADSETALRLAQEEALRDYQSLVEKTTQIQKEYSEQNENLNSIISRISDHNNSLYKEISTFTSGSSSNDTLSDKSNADRLFLAGELLSECVGRKQYFAIEAEKLKNSVNALQAWGEAVLEINENINTKEDDIKVEKD